MAANLSLKCTWDAATQGDRRCGSRQRKPVGPASTKVAYLHDRRLGLGRRWADWCRPTAARAKSGLAALLGEPAPWIR